MPAYRSTPLPGIEGAIAAVISPSEIILTMAFEDRIASTSLRVSRTIEHDHRQILDPLT